VKKEKKREEETKGKEKKSCAFWRPFDCNLGGSSSSSSSSSS
jgi:hypothetical protein